MYDGRDGWREGGREGGKEGYLQVGREEGGYVEGERRIEVRENNEDDRDGGRVGGCESRREVGNQGRRVSVR